MPTPPTAPSPRRRTTAMLVAILCVGSPGWLRAEEQCRDITDLLQARLLNGGIQTLIRNAVPASVDPTARRLRIDYTVEECPGSITLEQPRFVGMATAGRRQLRITKALYGELPDAEPRHAPGIEFAKDVTMLLRMACRDDCLEFPVDYQLLGDPLVGVRKSLECVYQIGSTMRTTCVSEGEMLRLPEDTGPLGPLRIVSARFGLLADRLGVIEVTTLVRQATHGSFLRIPINRNTFTDPAAGVLKNLRVEYRVNGQPGVRTLPQNQTMALTADRNATLEITRATYGDLPPEADHTPAGVEFASEVTDLLQAAILNHSLRLTVNDEALGGDPMPDRSKCLRLTFGVGGVVRQLTVPQATVLDLPRPEDGPGELTILSARYGAAETNVPF